MNRKEFVLNAVSRKQDLVVEVSDRIFDFAETGFHEFETAKLYQQVLEKEGFAVEMLSLIHICCCDPGGRSHGHRCQ